MNEPATGFTTPFDADDAIFEDNLIDMLTTHVQAGGALFDACESLHQSYEGFPQMLRLVTEWIDIYGDGTNILESAFQTSILANEANMISRLNEALAKPGAKEILAQVVSSDRWSAIVSQIAMRHKGSNLHNMLIREKRLKDAGLDLDVVASADNFILGMEEQFSAFFSSAAVAKDKSVRHLWERISAMCAYDEHTLIVGLRYLCSLSRRSGQIAISGLYKRIGEEVRQRIVLNGVAGTSVSEQEKKHEIFRMFILIDAAAAGVTIRRSLVDALVNVMVSGGTIRSSEQDVRILVEVYGFIFGDIDMSGIIQDGDKIMDGTADLSTAEKVFLIETLCHKEVLDDLMNATFSHYHRSYSKEKVPDTAKRRCMVLLLAYIEMFRTMPESSIHSVLDTPPLRESFRNNLKAIVERFDSIAAACEACPPGTPWYKIKKGHAKTLVDAVGDPLMASAVYMWAREGLKGTEENVRALEKTAPRHLAFLQAVAEVHLQLRPRILDAVHEAFVRDYPGLDITQIEDMRDNYIKYIIALARIQMTPEVVDAFYTNWAGDERVDKAHLRRFISGLLDTISIPFSEELWGKVSRLVRHERVEAALDNETKQRISRLQEAGRT
ncbi:hypothetical protein BWQ96_09506 [Gracilariopsis chorda]|uniref:Uncharacterized protein n=1 Tax=Gracilariopsis chorda TaxID=448386 RepID=A0A2V3IFC8_9FLOR|nr:hypothetical protein BWQ96_09506 [Gracilariopsis chorda]|eukprot:PXF40796.1 hypothetical protein BWQ96_09506 [Gracilariopsis chorda]